MESQSFILKDLSVQKTPGLPRGLPPFRFATNINVVFGVNGSGKSSTARAIRQLIWRHELAGITAETAVAIGTDIWDIKLDGNRATVQRNGVDEALVGLPASEASHRYLLALHELVGGHDSDLAAEIIRLSIGGYDLEKARATLQYAAGPRWKNTNEFKAVEKANKDFDNLKKEQEALKSDEARLDSLNKTREQGEIATKEIGWYEKLASWLDTKGRLDQVSDELAAFPDIFESITGEEYSSIVDLEEQLRTIEKNLLNADNEVAKGEKLIALLGLPATGIGPIIITELEEWITLIENSERELRDTEKLLEQTTVKEQQALMLIGSGTDAEHWTGISLADIGPLDELLRRHHLLRSEKQAVESMIRVLVGEEHQTNGPNTEQLNTGIRALSNWLQEPQENTSMPRWWLLVLAIAGVVTALGVYFLGPVGLSGIALIVLAVLLAGRSRKKETGYAQTDYNSTGLERLPAWNRDNAVEKMNVLVGQLKEAIGREKTQARVEVYQQELKALQPRLGLIERERGILQDRLHLLPDAPTEDLKTFDSLAWFISRVSEWQTFHDEKLSLIAKSGRIKLQMATQLQHINTCFASCNAGQAANSPSATAILRQLKEADKRWLGTTADIAHQREMRDSGLAQKVILENKQHLIYTRLDLQDGMKEEARQLIARLPVYKRAKQEQQSEAKMLLEKEGQLKAHSLFGQFGGEMEHAHPDTVQEKLRELGVIAERLEQTKKEINEIGAKIDMKKKENRLEEALLKKEEALDDLSAMYEANLSAVTGKLIFDRLKQQSGDSNRPEVFRRAKAIFSRITGGRYELVIQEGNEPSFRAYDTVNRVGQPLSDLSTGTRIQLLMAVRLAFIETQETSIRLPVLADELLANSDDDRAKAIIGALTEISREGRQIFYFTAQKDEVYKWKSFLNDQPDITFEILELDGRSNQASQFVPGEPAIASYSFRSDVPDPGEKSHAEYGELLEVERFDTLTETPAALHLWYLIEDTKVLTDLLRRGISKWGQLEAFLRHGAKLPGWNEETMGRLKDRVAFLDRYQDLYRQGRPRPIGRDELAKSNAVSGKFMDTVTEKLMELKGNPRKLLDALRNRGVAAFRQSSADELEEYLIGNGFLDELEIVPHDEILLRLNAFLTHTQLNLPEAEQFINRVLKVTGAQTEPVPGNSDAE